MKDLLTSLLNLDPDERLGSKRGIVEIKEHPFFSDIDWRALESKEAQPFMRRPPLEVEILSSNFDD